MKKKVLEETRRLEQTLKDEQANPITQSTVVMQEPA